MNAPIDWLLGGEPWVEYRVRRDLLGQFEADHEVRSARASMLANARLLDMLRVLRSRADGNGCFTPESIWTARKGWEFGQKQEPSRWLTLSAWRIIGRIEGTAPAV